MVVFVVWLALVPSNRRPDTLSFWMPVCEWTNPSESIRCEWGLMIVFLVLSGPFGSPWLSLCWFDWCILRLVLFACLPCRTYLETSGGLLGGQSFLYYGVHGPCVGWGVVVQPFGEHPCSSGFSGGEPFILAQHDAEGVERGFASEGEPLGCY